MDGPYTKKSCVLILLVALLCVERAQGLRCYQCTGVTSAASCITFTCPYSDGVCVSQEVEAIVESEKVKAKNMACAPTCPSNENSIENIHIKNTDIKSKISCCKEDLCNAAVPTGGSTWTLAGVLLFSLGSIILQVLL